MAFFINYIWFGGRPPLFLRFFPNLPLAPRAPTLGDLAGPTLYPEGSPHFKFFTSATDWGEYGGDVVLVFVRWFWFGWFAFRGLRPPAPLFFSGLPPKTLHKANQMYRFCRLVALRLSTQVVSQFGTALTILQAAPVGDIIFCRESVKVIIIC